jgi:hypothetical protein
MRFALEASVEARIRLPRDIDEPWFHGKRLKITRDADGFIAKIRVEGPVEEQDMISNVVEQLPNGMLHFSGAGGVEAHRQLETELQLIESTLGLYFKLTRVRWEFAEAIAIPETEAENAAVQFNNFKISHVPPNAMREPTLADFYLFLQMGNCARDLASTMAFYREGMHDLDTMRFITAFFSFYFVMEGLYSNRKWRANEVTAEYLKSDVLTKSIETALAAPGFQRPRTGLIYSIENFLQMANSAIASYAQKNPLKQARAPLARDVAGVIEMIVWVRGELHHFGNKDGPVGSPFTHQRYEMLATFMHDVCLQALNAEVLARVKEAERAAKSSEL